MTECECFMPEVRLGDMVGGVNLVSKCDRREMCISIRGG